MKRLLFTVLVLMTLLLISSHRQRPAQTAAVDAATQPTPAEMIGAPGPSGL